MINNQLNNELKNLYQINHINNGVNPNFNYINNINSNLGNSINGKDLNNLYNLYKLNNVDINAYNFHNLPSNLYQINNLNGNTFNNNGNNHIINGNIINPNNLYNISNINNNNFNNINFINFNPNHNYNIDINKIKLINYNNNHNHNHINYKNIHNQNHINNHNNINIEDGNIITDNELSDSQIDYLFSQLYTLPKEVCLFLYIINKKGVSYFISLVKTIKGSKYLQNILFTNPPKYIEIDFITKIICSNYKEIMCDYYGNYFLQKFFPFCTHKHRMDILYSIKNDYIDIANNICGNHSLQCLISLQTSKEEKEIIRLYTQNNLKELCYGGNSSHVISKIIKTFKEPERQYINTFVLNNLLDLCVDSNGICIVKEFIYNIESNYHIKLIISTFEKETTKLTLNQFGNFIIQEVIKFFGYNYCKKIIKNLINNIVEFSISKFSSNVIDFLLEYLSKKQFYRFCKVIKIIFLKESNFKEMIKNKFSIYVIENCLELLTKINENYYINSIKNNLGSNNYNSKSDYSDSDSQSENNIIQGNNDGDTQEEDKYSYNNFCKLKKHIFQFIENNSAAKEKKKILALIKANKYKYIEA